MVSEGVICSVDRSRPDVVRWKRQFDAPIVHAWRVVRGKLVKVDLFSSGAIPQKVPAANIEGTSGEDGGEGGESPLLYSGKHNNMLYIQESQRLEDSRVNFPAVMGDQMTGEFPRVSWRPYLISSHSRTPVINHGSKERDKELPLLTYDDKSRDNTALAVFSGSGEKEREREKKRIFLLNISFTWRCFSQATRSTPGCTSTRTTPSSGTILSWTTSRSSGAARRWSSPPLRRPPRATPPSP